MVARTYFPPLGPDDPPETRPDGRRDAASWHVGCMVTQLRAISVATALFPAEVADGSDCKAEDGREGEPCRICAGRNEVWTQRVREVRKAMMDAFR